LGYLNFSATASKPHPLRFSHLVNTVQCQQLTEMQKFHFVK